MDKSSPHLQCLQLQEVELGHQAETVGKPDGRRSKGILFIRNGRINARDVSNKKATDTIEQYDLNNAEQLRPVRCEIEKKIREDLAEYQTHYSQDKDYWSGKLLKLMASSGRESAYSATKATAILLDISYSLLKQTLTEEGRWTAEFERAEQELAFCALI